jgi:hypothetical protein
MTQIVQSGEVPSPENQADAKERRWRAKEKLGGLFYTCPTSVARDPLSGAWSREYLKLFVEGNPELLAWARQRELPSSLYGLASGTRGGSPQYLSIFEQLREFRPEVAFRPEHLSQYRLGKLRKSPEAGFVGPYDMPTIDTVLPLLSGLIIADKWPELLDAPRPERKPESTNWKRDRRLGARETRSWHW